MIFVSFKQTTQLFVTFVAEYFVLNIIYIIHLFVFVIQMVWFRENWYEEVLRQLRLGLAKCYNIAFDSRGSVADAQITPHTLNFIKKLVSTFGIGIGNF